MPHIFLYGPPGVGKSTLGKILARNLKLPFVDLDRVVEGEAGESIAKMMTRDGESVFRDLEAGALERVIRGPDSVIALGGGSLLREENRARAEQCGNVIVLSAETGILLERLGPRAAARPLLSGDVEGKLKSLLASRREHYASFAHRVRVDGQSALENAAQAQLTLGRFHLKAMGEYDVLVEDGGLATLGAKLRALDLLRPILVTDQDVAELHADAVIDSLHAAGFETKVLSLPSGEAHKNLESVQSLWQGFLEHGIDRHSTVLALGGGVINDLAGFAAATFMRGINWVALPTTLLAMVDASLGGKTGFDLPQGKNLVGSFHAPKLVLADPRVLLSLPEPELISGLAEVVKHGVIADLELFEACEHGLDALKLDIANIIKRAMSVKIRIIEDDPHEHGRRAVLNFGHTVGHAIELVSGFRLRHGQTVAIGMSLEARYAARIGLADSKSAQRITALLSQLSLPVNIPNDLDREGIVRAMRIDKKKNADAINLALPLRIGEVQLVPVSDVSQVLEDA